MEELISKVAEKTGIPADKAKAAVETVLAFLKSKLPAAMGGQLDQAVSGDAPAGLGDVAGKIGGMFGK